VLARQACGRDEVEGQRSNSREAYGECNRSKGVWAPVDAWEDVNGQDSAVLGDSERTSLSCHMWRKEG
jgi:hypothetical protein